MQMPKQEENEIKQQAAEHDEDDEEEWEEA